MKNIKNKKLFKSICAGAGFLAVFGIMFGIVGFQGAGYLDLTDNAQWEPFTFEDHSYGTEGLSASTGFELDATLAEADGGKYQMVGQSDATEGLYVLNHGLTVVGDSAEATLSGITAEAVVVSDGDDAANGQADVEIKFPAGKTDRIDTGETNGDQEAEATTDPNTPVEEEQPTTPVGNDNDAPGNGEPDDVIGFDDDFDDALNTF